MPVGLGPETAVRRTYLYGFGTGGGMPTTGFATGQTASVTNANGNIVAAIADTMQSSDSYTTQSAYDVAGGVAVSGFARETAVYGRNEAAGATGAAASVSVSAPGSLVVVVAIGGDEQALSISGLPALSIDAGWPGSPALALEIADAYPAPGRYTVSEITSQSAAGQDPGNAADLIGVFVFVPSSNRSSGRPTTYIVNPLVQWGDTGVSLVAGEQVTVDATGTIYRNTNQLVRPMSTPAGFPWDQQFQEDGTTYQCPDASSAYVSDILASGLPCFSLVAKIGASGSPFEIGSRTSFTSNGNGDLFLGWNTWYWGFDSGSYKATITTHS